MSGTCRTCMCQLDSGNVMYRMEWHGIGRVERQQDYILSFVASPILGHRD